MGTRDVPSGHLSYHVEAIRFSLGQLVADLRDVVPRELFGPLAASVHALSCCVVDMEQAAERAHARAESLARGAVDPWRKVEQYHEAKEILLALLRIGPPSHGG